MEFLGNSSLFLLVCLIKFSITWQASGPSRSRHKAPRQTTPLYLSQHTNKTRAAFQTMPRSDNTRSPEQDCPAGVPVIRPLGSWRPPIPRRDLSSIMLHSRCEVPRYRFRRHRAICLCSCRICRSWCVCLVVGAGNLLKGLKNSNRGQKQIKRLG